VFSLWISGWRGGALYPLRVAAKRRGESGAVLFYLIGAGAFVVLERNGRHAIAWLGDHASPAMILLDLMMPEMDGFEFLDPLATRVEWREIPVVVITAKQLTTAER
jgi:CheY-like chemotaxis protein